MLSCLFFFVSAHRLCAWLSKEEREQANASSPFHLTEHAVFVCMARRDRDALLVCRARRIRLYVQTDSVTIDQVTCPACPFRFLCVASASVCDRQQRGKVRRLDERASPPRNFVLPIDARAYAYARLAKSTTDRQTTLQKKHVGLTMKTTKKPIKLAHPPKKDGMKREASAGKLYHKLSNIQLDIEFTTRNNNLYFMRQTIAYTAFLQN